LWCLTPILPGEFAKKRHEVAAQTIAEQRAWIRTLQTANREQREREQQLALQEQAVNAQTWAAYMGTQGVTCTTTKVGYSATIHCN
jgi:hypothetical protein